MHGALRQLIWIIGYSHFIWYTRVEVNTSHCSWHAEERDSKVEPIVILTRRAFAAAAQQSGSRKGKQRADFPSTRIETRREVSFTKACRF
jgi:hypothetical protein